MMTCESEARRTDFNFSIICFQRKLLIIVKRIRKGRYQRKQRKSYGIETDESVFFVESIQVTTSIIFIGDERLIIQNIETSILILFYPVANVTINATLQINQKKCESLVNLIF